MEKLRDYNLYLINESNVKYGYSGNALSTNASYTKGGLLNVDEFNVSNSNGNTYLFNGTKGWNISFQGTNQKGFPLYDFLFLLCMILISSHSLFDFSILMFVLQQKKHRVSYFRCFFWCRTI